ncbi:MAG: tyrosine transporter [Gammaproteobacteria bacterium]|nr:tyrosine transporter [Gammaproteobacteria bacterium]
MKLYQNKTFGSILLIAGTQIGAGMLALPITTAKGGIFNSTLLFILAFSYMLLTLFLLLEANLYEQSYEANIISMSKKRLGTIGQFIAWFSFLFLLYSVAAAYISAGGSLLAPIIQGAIHHGNDNWGTLLFIIIFGTTVFFGAWLIDYINRILMIGLIASYLTLLFFVIPHVDFTQISAGNPKYLLAAVPVVVLSFTSHIIVPSLRAYLKNDIVQLKRALIIGSIVPLIFYIIWEMLILGVMPLKGEFGLAQIASGPHPVASLAEALHSHLGLTWIAVGVGSFSFFALVTSFLGVILALMDFLADGFQIKKTLVGRALLFMITIIPPLIFALFYPSGFVLALSYAGVFVAILYGILPVMMIWKARYQEKIKAPFQMPGGKVTLIISLVGAVIVILFQIAASFEWLPK